MLSKPRVPLTPEHVDLLDKPDILITWLRRFADFFSDRRIDWYIQGSLAGRLYGLRNRAVTDLDLRTRHDLDDLLRQLPSDLHARAQMRGPASYTYGEFRNHCIVIDLGEPDTHIDITSEIRTYRADLGLLFDIPFDARARARRVCSEYADEFPVCSIEYLLIYKLVNQRDGSERKNDLPEACHLLESLRYEWELIR